MLAHQVTLGLWHITYACVTWWNSFMDSVTTTFLVFAKRLFSLLSFFTLSFLAFLPPCLQSGISAMVPLFVNVNPYRWGGWFVVASASLYTVSFLIVFQKKIDKSKSVCIPWVYRKRSSYCDRRLVLAKLLIVSSNLIQQ